METSRCWGKMFIPWFVGKWLLEVARWNWSRRCWSEKHLRPTFLQTLANLPSVIWSIIFLISFISYWFFLLFQDSSSCCCDHNANTSQPNRNHLSPCQPDSSHLQLFPNNQWEGEFHHILGIPACSVQHKYSQKIKVALEKLCRGTDF